MYEICMSLNFEGFAEKKEEWMVPGGENEILVGFLLRWEIC